MRRYSTSILIAVVETAEVGFSDNTLQKRPQMGAYGNKLCVCHLTLLPLSTVKPC